MVIDSTGDGDLFPSAGATFDMDIDPALRIARLTPSWWFAGVDINLALDFQRGQRDKYMELMRELAKQGGDPNFGKTWLSAELF